LHNIARTIVILASTRMFFLMFEFFHSRLGPTTLIKAQNVWKLNLVQCWNVFFEKLPKSWFFIYPTTLSYFHMLQTFNGMFTNSKKNSNTLIIFHWMVCHTYSLQ
jgi:hypothetical protein